MSDSQSKKLDQLTFTRFIAALSVVVFHGGMNIFPFNVYPVNPLFTGGPVAVGYFFVLSGFVMSLVYYWPGGKINFKNYWLARFSRIYPIYLISFLLTCIHYIKIIGKIGTQNYLAGLLLYQAWIPDFALSFNFPAWSLSIEVFFYLVFPFLIVLLGRRSTRFLIWLSLGFWAGSLFIVYGLSVWLPVTEFTVNLFSYFPLFHLSTFFLGVVGGIWYVRIGKSDPSRQTAARFLLVLGLGLISVGLLEKRAIGIPLSKGLLTPFFLVVVLALASETTKIGRMLSRPWLVRLGDASYGVYILHIPIRWLYEDILYLARIRVSEILFFYSYVIILILMAVLLFVQVERPVRDWLRRNPTKLILILCDVCLLAIALILGYFFRTGTGIIAYADSLAFTLRIGIPVYFLILLLFRFYSPVSHGMLASKILRSLLPAITLGTVLLTGLTFVGKNIGWIGAIPRSIPIIHGLLSLTLLALLRFIFQKWRPILVS